MCVLFRLQHPSMAIVKGAGLVMKAIIEEADRGLAMRMQEWALSEGAFPRHLHSALFAQSLDSRVLTNRSAPLTLQLPSVLLPTPLLYTLFSPIHYFSFRRRRFTLYSYDSHVLSLLSLFASFCYSRQTVSSTYLTPLSRSWNKERNKNDCILKLNARNLVSMGIYLKIGLTL